MKENSMVNYFEHKIKELESEIVRVETATAKSAQNIVLKIQKLTVELKLSLDGHGFAATSSTPKYRIIMNEDSLLYITLDQYGENVYDGHYQTSTNKYRRVQYSLYRWRWNNDNERDLDFYGVGNQNDVDALGRGESVSIKTEVTIMCTDDFRIEAIDE